MRKKFTLSRALLWIFCLAILLNASLATGIKGYKHLKRTSRIDHQVPIKAIVQTGPQKEALKTTYLAELLGLSIDQPVLSCDFNPKEAMEILLSSPVIKAAEVGFKEPGILYIDYTVRQPICFLRDFANVGMDEEAVPFPIHPFFTPKKLPEIYLGLEEQVQWNQPIEGPKVELAFELLKTLQGPIVCDLFNVKRIDVSSAFAPTCGSREIVILTEDEIYLNQQGKEVCFLFPRILRLSTKNYSQELSNYLKLRENLLEKEQLELQFPEGESIVTYPPKKIDLRIAQLAFIEEGT